MGGKEPSRWDLGSANSPEGNPGEGIRSDPRHPYPWPGFSPQGAGRGAMLRQGARAWTSETSGEAKAQRGGGRVRGFTVRNGCRAPGLHGLPNCSEERLQDPVWSSAAPGLSVAWETLVASGAHCPLVPRALPQRSYAGLTGMHGHTLRSLVATFSYSSRELEEAGSVGSSCSLERPRRGWERGSQGPGALLSFLLDLGLAAAPL